MLYHTRENMAQHDDPNRNIKSNPDSIPIVIDPSYVGHYDLERKDFMAQLIRRRKSNAITVYSRDIGLTELFDVEFELHPQGKYSLNNGQNVNIYATTLTEHTNKLHHFSLS